MDDYRIVPDSLRIDVIRGRQTPHEALVAELARGRRVTMPAIGSSRRLGRLHLAAEEHGSGLRSAWSADRELIVWFEPH